MISEKLSTVQLRLNRSLNIPWLPLLMIGSFGWPEIGRKLSEIVSVSNVKVLKLAFKGVKTIQNNSMDLQYKMLWNLSNCFKICLHFAKLLDEICFKAMFEHLTKIVIKIKGHTITDFDKNVGLETTNYNNSNFKLIGYFKMKHHYSYKQYWQISAIVFILFLISLLCSRKMKSREVGLDSTILCFGTMATRIGTRTMIFF